MEDGGIRIGYACLAVGIPGGKITRCRLKNATEKKLRVITADNLAALKNIIAYNARNNIRLFRISSDIVPFASHPAGAPGWKTEFTRECSRIGEMIKDAKIRVSMHPGQYTVLNSPREDVYQNALSDLAYHADFLDAIGADLTCKIILHAGGAYGNKREAMDRLVRRASRLPAKIKRRVALENDDKIYAADEILILSERTGFPAVYDNLHNALNPSKEYLSDREWIARFAQTWRLGDGRPKVHYSQPGGRRGAHSKTIHLKEFLAFFESMKSAGADIMLEVKDKNLSAIKCGAAVRGYVKTAELEVEWARYKYLVLSRSAALYGEIRNFLKTKGRTDAAAFYTLIDDARALPADSGAQKNAAQHVWGYFKKEVTEKEKGRFCALSRRADFDETAMKRFLLRCAMKYGPDYLKESYYFYLN